MNRPLPWLILAALAAAAVWFVSRPDGDPRVEPIEGVERGGAREDGAEPTAPGGLRGTGSEEPPPPVRPEPRGAIVDPRTIPRGGLEVLPLGPDQQPIPPGELSMRIEAVGRAFWSQPLALPDPETKVWSFKNIPAGPVQVRVSGDHVVETVAEATIEKDVVKSLKVLLDRAGALAYHVVLYSGEQPPEVTLTLLDLRDKPVAARYQERSPTRLTQAQKATTMKQGPDGLVLGVLPGRYRLKAVSPNDEWDAVEVEAVTGQTVAVEIRLRR
jgi:hypothetical protein